MHEKTVTCWGMMEVGKVDGKKANDRLKWKWGEDQNSVDREVHEEEISLLTTD